MYDAAAVGARCSGAAAAMLLPRKGYRAVMLDRNAADNDTLHPTHFVQPKAADKLKKWGLRAALAAACPSFDNYSFDFSTALIRGKPPAVDGDAPACSAPANNASLFVI